MFYVVEGDHLKKFIYNLYIYIYIVLSCYFLYFTAVFFLIFFPLRTNFSKSEVFGTGKKRTKERVNTTNKKDNDRCEFKIREDIYFYFARVGIGIAYYFRLSFSKETSPLP